MAKNRLKVIEYGSLRATTVTDLNIDYIDKCIVLRIKVEYITGLGLRIVLSPEIDREVNRYVMISNVYLNPSLSINGLPCDTLTNSRSWGEQSIVELLVSKIISTHCKFNGRISKGKFTITVTGEMIIEGDEVSITVSKELFDSIRFITIPR